METSERSATIYGDISRSFPLPFYRFLNIPPKNDEVTPNPNHIHELCTTKIITGGLSGAVIGVGLGLLMGAMGDVSPIQIINGREVPQPPLREQVRLAYKSTISKTSGWAKSFGILTALFGGIECVVEKYRGKHDVWNPVVSGCAVGATLSAKAGPTASCAGCVGFAAFSLAVDLIMSDHS